MRRSVNIIKLNIVVGMECSNVIRRKKIRVTKNVKIMREEVDSVGSGNIITLIIVVGMRCIIV